MQYRLGVDVGTTSIGWCILSLDDGEPKDIIDMGVRIFSSGRNAKTNEPLAVARRNARGQRRRRDRFKSRQERLMQLLTENNLMPRDRDYRKKLELLNPYELRAKALDQKISLHELGRALFHINQRRGFKSNLKNSKKDNDNGAIKGSIKKLGDFMAAANIRTLGEYLYKRQQEGKTTRVKNNLDDSKLYDFYPKRSMYEDETKKIWKTQAKFHPELTDSLYTKICTDTIFYQRDLKPQLVGLCSLEDNAKRERLAQSIVQKFRILQEVNNLKLINYHHDSQVQLTPEMRQIIIQELLYGRRRELTFDGIRRRLNLSADHTFNLESENRRSLKGDETFRKLSHENCFGAVWLSLSDEAKEEIVTNIFEKNEDDFISWLCTKYQNIDEVAAENIFNTKLQEGYGNVSKVAISKLMPYLEQGDIYSEACKKAEYNHSDQSTGEIHKELPYYGAVDVLQKSIIGGSFDENDEKFPEKYYGKINNPTVHVGLNQLRKLVNAIIQTYGTPTEIVVELARELKTNADEIKNDQNKNKKDNERINEELEKLSVKKCSVNRMKYKLWEDLARDPEERCCPFSGGEPIRATEIFSDAIEIEHILPFSQTYDDSRANKVLCRRQANRDKKNRSPFEAFGHSPNGYNWEAITRRAQNLPGNKQWRFAPDAMDKFDKEEKDGTRGGIARQLIDTQYFAKVTRSYLTAVCPAPSVWNIPGRLTAMLRHEWGLNSLLNENEEDMKNRKDHRHHAIDALVVAATSRSMMQRISKAAENAERNGNGKLIQGLELPCSHFDRKVLQDKVDKIIISHKPDHGNARKAIEQGKTIACLHEATAYGYIGIGDKKGTFKIAKRVPVALLEKKKHIEEIADNAIRHKLLLAVKDKKEGSNEWKLALQEFSKKYNIKNVRKHFDKTIDSLIGICCKNEKNQIKTKPYKYVASGGNYCAEIFCPNKGKNADKWQIEIITDFAVHQKNFSPKWKKEYPMGKLIMRLQIDDMVAYEEDGATKICRVKKLATDGRIYLRAHNIAKEEADKNSWAASVSQLQLKDARKVAVDVMGKVKDPQKTKIYK